MKSFEFKEIALCVHKLHTNDFGPLGNLECKEFENISHVDMTLRDRLSGAIGGS